jgi:hypothetical protein
MRWQDGFTLIGLLTVIAITEQSLTLDMCYRFCHNCEMAHAKSFTFGWR